jgi:hypothetical protein
MIEGLCHDLVGVYVTLRRTCWSRNARDSAKKLRNTAGQPQAARKTIRVQSYNVRIFMHGGHVEMVVRRPPVSEAVDRTADV